MQNAGNTQEICNFFPIIPHFQQRKQRKIEWGKKKKREKKKGAGVRIYFEFESVDQLDPSGSMHQPSNLEVQFWFIFIQKDIFHGTEQRFRSSGTFHDRSLFALQRKSLIIFCLVLLFILSHSVVCHHIVTLHQQ